MPSILGVKRKLIDELDSEDTAGEQTITSYEHDIWKYQSELVRLNLAPFSINRAPCRSVAIKTIVSKPIYHYYPLIF